LLDESAGSEAREKRTAGLGHDFAGTLAVLAFFQLRALAAEPIQWRIGGAADLVEILCRPIFAVHREMPESAISLFAVSGLRGNTNFSVPFEEIWAYAEDCSRSPNLLVKYA
jgi:hypothetical protein